MIRIHKFISGVAIIITSLLLADQSFGQDRNMDSIAGRLQEYIRKYPQEKLFLHTDKDFYLAGEVMWFKIYHVDASLHKPVYWSKIAYVELLDNASKPVWQGKISLKADEDNGSYHLPLSLNTGTYLLRAYTNWMKNNGPGSFFAKEVVIVNTLKNPVNLNNVAARKYDADFFPEGGNLVKGIQSKIAFRISNSSGKGEDFKGYIISDKNDTITEFHPLKFGIGSFLFTPAENISYRASILFKDGTILIKELPVAYNNGYVMNVASKDSDRIKLAVHSGSVNANDPVLLICYSTGGVKMAEKLFLVNGSTEFIIQKNKLDEGINRITLFNGHGQPVCERLYFNRPLQKRTIEINTDNSVYTTRKRVNVTVKRDSVYKDSSFHLSMTVFQMDSFQMDRPDIVKYLWLTSELRGKVESPGYYFSGNDPDIAEATDNLMLSHGWRKFKWENLFESKDSFIKYPLEYSGHIITAKVIDTRTNLPADNIQVFLSIPGTHFQFYSAQSDPSGIAKFDVKDFYGAGELVVQSNTQKDSFYRVDIQSPFYESYADHQFPAFSLTGNRLGQLEDFNISMQTQNVYSSDSLKRFLLPYVKDTLPFYGLPVNSYLLDDYTRFTTMEEVLREYVREIYVGVRGGQKFVKLFNENLHEFATDDILVLLDGIALVNQGKIFSYDPLKVRRLDVIPKNYILGPSTFSGIASFVTYDGNFQGFELDPRSVTVDYEGIQLQREFYSPVYETQQQVLSRIPDFRNTLYWSPEIMIGKNSQTNINFYTSDSKGAYMVELQGIDANGNPVYSSTTFIVK